MAKKEAVKKDKGQPPLAAELERAVRGLLYRSEADYPFEVVLWPRDEVEDLDEKALLRYEKYPKGTPIRAVDFDFFFEAPTTPQEWHGARERKRVEGYRRLVKLLKDNLTDLRVFKVGEVEVDVYVGGRSESGDWVGLYTNAVET